MAGDADSRLDGPLGAALADVAAEGVDGAEALRDALGRRLRRRLGWRHIVIERDRALLDGWPEHVEAVDLGVRGRFSGRTAAIAQVSWWDGPIDLQEALWQALRAAAVVRAGAGAGYLVAGAPATAWAAAPAEPPLAAGERAVAPVLAEGTGPEAVVPSRVGVAEVGEAALGVGGTPYGLRAVRVWPGGGDLRAREPDAAP